jgi:hypothetical protein
MSISNKASFEKRGYIIDGHYSSSLEVINLVTVSHIHIKVFSIREEICEILAGL